LLAAELEDRERRSIDRRIKEAHLPRVKTLDEFDFRQAPTVSPTQLSELATGRYLRRAEPIVFIGDSGTGKDPLADGVVRGGMPSGKTRPFHHGSRAGQ
jgi:DNA replication protein DnaC